MTHSQTNVYLAAILMTVADVEGDQPVPLGPIYAALMGRIGWGEWELLVRILVDGGLATVTPETISLTEQGQRLAAKCAATVASSSAR